MKLTAKISSKIVEIISLLYILLFVYAAVSKLLDFENFQVQLGQSPLLSPYAVWVSWMVPVMELLIVILLLVPSCRNIGLLASISMMTMFTAYIFIILHYSSFVPCSCGGILEKMTWNVHMVFNLAFVLIGIIALGLDNGTCSRRTAERNRRVGFKTILTSMLFSIILVLVLFLTSEEIMKYENPFIRRYPQHPITQQKTVNLKFNSYYFAGNSDSHIYLSNYTDPLHIIVFDTKLKNKQTIRIQFNPKDITFKSVKISVRGSYFFLMDGTVPCIYRGSTEDWKITHELKGIHYFTSAQPVDSSSVVFRSNSGKNSSHIIGSYKEHECPKITYNDSLLQQQIDGVFDTDGMLVYNERIRRMVYLYYYRNEFIVADQNAKLKYRGNTIDTISRAQIKVAYLKDNTERKMAAPPLVVNADLMVYQNLLFVHSKIQGQFEDQKLWQKAAIIDVYDLNTKVYLMSFAVYHSGDKKLRSFIVTDDNFYALMGDELLVYKLRNMLKKEMKLLK
ncbi:putative membrane protein YphA (DoxX/SURF4 family) [Flavobacterium sp. 9]|uniref:MauE/DoxX family redox-associated membrane protein n=1 Tax=Flavobacterium sp. 9 TaxID=2035198 RepID=UPI000C17B3D0|nr:MauE/DoxX family redox-associated membrane protein [Flavobacterium sp. 9]PIF34525.1 putative membrane protein YphA (DoxX/SURF4 family) [Flavobacterium sp. 9]